MKLIYLSLLIVACGVKNDPLPPGVRVDIGKGKPESTMSESVEKYMKSTEGEVLDEIQEKKKENE